jgi:diguanylate cyclase (GGDEF)-like protein
MVVCGPVAASTAAGREATQSATLAPVSRQSATAVLDTGGAVAPGTRRIHVRPGLRDLDLSPHLRYLVDADGRADSTSMFALAAQGRFAPLPGGEPTFGFQDGAYWLHARLFNEGNGEERWLLVLQYALLDYVDVYMRYPDGRVDHLASGDKLPFSARAIRYRHPNFWLNLPQRSEVELLVRVQSKSSIQAPLRIYTFSAFAEMERDAQLGIGIYDGILLALFFYNLVLWLSLRDSSHFWYMCHLAGFGLVLFCLNGLAFEYLWPSSPWLANHAIPLSMCLSQMAMHQFARLFLELPERWPLGDRISLALIVFYAIVGLASLWVDYTVSVQITTYSVFPGVLAVLYMAFHAIRRGYRPARLFLAAWTMLLLGTAMYASVSLGVLPKNFITEYGIQIGSAMEMILLSFALAYRYANLRSENENVVREANEQLERNVSRRTAELSAALEQLADANSRLRESNRRDVLTGMFNRRHFREVFEQMLHHAIETRQPLTLMLIDLDHFKRVNDEHGHLAGDECLRAFARFLEDCLAREVAVTARFGGEEFVVLLPGVTAAKASEIAERIRGRVAGAPVRFGCEDIAMTASIGVYSLPPGTSATADEVLHQADDALYAAKNAGRNRVHAVA